MTDKIAIPHYIKAFGSTVNEGELNVADIAQQVQRGELNVADIAQQVQMVELNVADIAQQVQRVEDNIKPLQPFRNKIINGDFRIWQRGTSLSPLNASTGAYLADRWYTANVGSGNSVSRAILDNKAYSKHTVSSNALPNAQVAIRQAIEGVQTLAGKSVTLSFTAKADAVKDIFIEIVQAYGTSYTIINLGRKTLNTSLQRYIVHFELPPLSKEETVGASSLQLQIWMSAGSNYSERTSGLPNQSGEFYFTDIQLEEGSVATAFEERPWAVEMQMCERYFQKSYHIDLPIKSETSRGCISYRVTPNGYLTVPIRLVSRMRTVPTIAVYTLNGVSGVVIDGVNYSAYHVLAVSDTSFNLMANAQDKATMEFHYAVDAEL